MANAKLTGGNFWGTEYDFKDAELTDRVDHAEMVADSGGACRYEDYGGDYEGKKSGLTVTKTGPKVIVDGTRSAGSNQFSYMFSGDEAICVVGSPYTALAGLSEGLKVQAGHKYRVRIRYMAGQIERAAGTSGSARVRFRLDALDESVQDPTDASITDRTALVDYRLEPGQVLRAEDLSDTVVEYERDHDCICGFALNLNAQVICSGWTVQFELRDMTEQQTLARDVAQSVVQERETDIILENAEAIDKILAAQWTQWNRDDQRKLAMFNFLHFSDPHVDEDGVKYLKRVVAAKEHLKAQGLLDDAICTGDQVKGSHGGGTYANWWLTTEGTKDILLGIGNHDTYVSNASHEKITPAVKYAYYFEDRLQDWGLTVGSNIQQNTSYYYKDYPGKAVSGGNVANPVGIRLVVVDPSLTGDDGGTEQAAWLATILEGARNQGLAVIVASHYLNTTAAIVDSGWSNALDRGNGTLTMAYDWQGTDIVAAVNAFVAGGGEFVCYLIGHLHRDLLAYPTGHPEQLIIGVCSSSAAQTTVSTGDANNGSNDLPRYDGTRTQDAFNVVTVDTYNKCIKCVRMGANVTNAYESRRAFCWDYANHRMVNEV